MHLHNSETQIPAMLFGTLTSRYPAAINVLLTGTSMLSAMALGGMVFPPQLWWECDALNLYPLLLYLLTLEVWS